MAKFSPHSESIESVLKHFETKKNGLSQEEARARLRRYGFNVFEREEKLRFLRLLLAQVKSPLVLILIFAGFVSVFLGEKTDAAVIFIAVLINTAIGVFQEGKASRAFEKLKESQKKFALVLRNGKEQQIEAKYLVPGDVIILESGFQAPADARIFESRALEIDESVLTGEWLPVEKGPADAAEEAALTDQKNTAFMGTLVVEGWAKAVVVDTGFRTELGRIAKSVEKERISQTPLQIGVKRLAWLIGGLVLAILILIFSGGLLRGVEFGEMFLMAVAIAVAAVPEGLPAATSVILALGMERILKKGGLVRKMPAAETLGSTSVILTDKTGTLTEAKMQVSVILTASDLVGHLMFNKSRYNFEVLKMGILTSRAFIENPQEELEKWKIRGRPMDRAMLVAGLELGIKPEELAKEMPEIDFLPFDAERRFAASLRRGPVGSSGPDRSGKTKLIVSGAPETILQISSFLLKDGKIIKLTDKYLSDLNQLYTGATSKGTRMIAAAFRDNHFEELPRDHDHIFENMVFAGFIGFHDPLRRDVKESVRAAQAAGVRVVMITGDHPATAKTVAREAGLVKNGSRMIEGKSLDKFSKKDLEKAVEKIDIFSRTLPHQKTAIVLAWQARGEVVAMTGDGINDAPALRRADIGVALGSGTEVAKEAAELVLVNDSFSVIVRAIEEGRALLDNLRKVITYLLATGFTEMVLVGGALLAGFALPVLPAQILWANLIQEGLMNFAFAFEPKEKDIMKRKPKEISSKKLINREMLYMILIIGLLTDVFLLALFFILRALEMPLAEVRTIMFAGLSVDAIFFAFSLKSLRQPIWKINIFSNLYLVGALFVSVLILLLAIFTPSLQTLLKLTPISFNQFMLIIGLGVLDLILIEWAKHKFVRK